MVRRAGSGLLRSSVLFAQRVGRHSQGVVRAEISEQVLVRDLSGLPVISLSLLCQGTQEMPFVREVDVCDSHIPVTGALFASGDAEVG